MKLLVTAVLMAVFAAIYIYLKEKIRNRALVFKSLATCMAVYLGLHGAIGHPGISQTVMSLGLVLCMAADVVLELSFQKGVIVFGTAHICFILAFTKMAGFRWYTIAVAAGICLVLFFVFRKDREEIKKLKSIALPYMTVLSVMAACAFTFWMAYGTRTSAMAVTGAMCFVVSDALITGRIARKKKSTVYNTVVLLFYYSAIYLFGAAVYMGLRAPL